MLAHIRKAIIAGVGAALAAFVAALVQAATETGITEDAVSKAIGLAAASGVTVGLATYKARNAGTVNGSDPATPPSKLTR